MQALRVLHYVESQTRAGRVLIVMSRHGIVDIVHAEQDAGLGDLLESVHARFRGTLLLPDDGTRGSWAAAAVARLDGVSASYVGPIDLGWSAPLMRPPLAVPAAVECQHAS